MTTVRGRRRRCRSWRRRRSRRRRTSRRTSLPSAEPAIEPAAPAATPSRTGFRRDARARRPGGGRRLPADARRPARRHDPRARPRRRRGHPLPAPGPAADAGRRRPPGSIRRPDATGSAASGGVRTPWLIGGAILALALLVGAVGIYLLLPSATIAVTPKTERIGPIPSTIVADTDRDPARPDAGRRPGRGDLDPGRGQRHVQRDRQARRADQGDRHGPLREPRPDQHQPDRRREHRAAPRPGSASGRNATITVPRAELVGLTIFPARASVKVTAVDGGPDGNVDAGTITIVPSGENSFFLKVTNPQPTSRRDAARSSAASPRPTSTGRWRHSTCRSQQAFQEAMADPALETDGATVFPSTGQLGEPTPTVDPDTLVGQEVTTFELGLSADGTVIAVDEAPVSSHRRDRRSRQRSRPATSWSPARSRSRSARRSSSARRSASRSRRPPSRSRSSTPTSSRRWSSASRSTRPARSSRRSARSRSTSRPTGPARSRASTAGSR